MAATDHAADRRPVAGSVLFDGVKKTVLIVSPQTWDGLKVSKHHYAAEVAALGHDVFFVEPPAFDLPRGHVAIGPSETPAIRIVRYAPWFPYQLKFHARSLFDQLMRGVAGRIVRRIGVRPDLVWDFDNSWQFASLKPFGARHSLLHLVDAFDPGRGDKGADVACFVAEPFRQAMAASAIPKFVVGHCISREFEAMARRVVAGEDGGSLTARPPDRVRVGYFGNLNHAAVDWVTIAGLVAAHPDVDFEFMGTKPDIISRTDRHAEAARNVMVAPNCAFPGILAPRDLVIRAETIDIWLLCYDRAFDPNNGANSHKLLEYLATGRVCVASRLETYVGSPLLITAGQADNTDVPGKFSTALLDVGLMNSAKKQAERADYALAHSYRAAVGAIDGFLTSQK